MLENYDFEGMFETNESFFTEKEEEILIEMEEKCESYDYELLKKGKCEYAYQLNKCWKLVNPEVSDGANVFFFLLFDILFLFSVLLFTLIETNQFNHLVMIS